MKCYLCAAQMKEDTEFRVRVTKKKNMELRFQQFICEECSKRIIKLRRFMAENTIKDVPR